MASSTRVLGILVVAFTLASTAQAESFFNDVPVEGGLILRLDASGMTSVNGGSATNGAFVDTWSDTSGLGHNASGAGTRRPIWNQSVGAINGRSSLTFDGLAAAGQGDHLDLDFSSVANAPGANLTAYIVATDTGQSAGGSCCRPLFGTADANFQSTAFGFSLKASDAGQPGIRLDKAGTNTGDFSLGGAPDGQFHIYSVLSNSTLTELFEDGNSLGTSGALTGTPTDLDYLIGGNNQIDARHYAGQIAEVLIFNQELTAAEHDLVGGFLAYKYGLTTAFSPFAPPALAPEPSSLVLSGIVLLSLGGWQWRRRRKS